MPWFWGSKSEDDSEYDSDEYTEGEYSDEEYEEYTDDEAEEEVEKEGDQDQANEKQEEEEENGDDDRKKEVVEEPATEKVETDGTFEKEEEDEEEESYVEVNKEDATASPKTAKDQAEAAEEENEEEKSEQMRSNSLLDNESVDKEEEVSSIVEDANEEAPKDTTPEVTVDPPPTEVPEESDKESQDDESDKSSHADVQPVVSVETVSSGDDDSEFSDDDTDDEDEELTSFADKQSMLLLAAEHDRVDILRAILTGDENEEVAMDKEALMNTGIPPLHYAISFGSTNTTQSLLRMGADPSIRPNIEEVQKHYASHQNKVEIKNMKRFDGISAWELAFGNEAYAKLEAAGATKRSSWVFGSAIQPVDGEMIVICPLDSIPAAKKEGIRHAFTAEALRCLGGDELERLKQLVDSGMPASTEIAEKDLYQWAVEMGALQCEEYLRPMEAAKHAKDETETNADSETPNETTSAETNDTKVSLSNARVLDRSRPGEEESCLQLKNKLVELDSLATALSTCVDNLAEEVSVCHGLLLMNGGASALASHVKSLKAQKASKEDQLHSAYIQLEALEDRLRVIVLAAGPIGNEVMGLSDAELKQQQQDSLNNEKSAEASNNDSNDNGEDSETEREELLEKIAASENKIRKLRISITDLSEESARDLKEVERRGLSGGIDLVRGLRDEIREVDFSLTEAKSLISTCQAKITLIKAKVSPETELPATTEAAMDVLQPLDTEASEPDVDPQKTPSEKIATGDSQAIAVRAPGNQGFFRIDLWQVILRIIGMNRAADRRALEVAQRQRHQQKKLGVFDSTTTTTNRPDPIHIMTV